MSPVPLKVNEGDVKRKLTFVIFTYEGYILPIALKLKEEGNDVIIGMVDNTKNLFTDEQIKNGAYKKEESDKKELRWKTYEGILEKHTAEEVIKQMKSIKNKEDYFILSDSNNCFRFCQQALDMGFTNGFFPTEEDRDFEENRMKAKEFVKDNYTGIEMQEVQEFKKVDDAKKFLEETDKRWVLKSLGDVADTFCPQTEDVEQATEQVVSNMEIQKSILEKEGFILEEMINTPLELTPQAVFYNGELCYFSLDLENKPVGAGNIGFQVGCFDRETEIMTLNGWKKFEELDIKKDLIANLNYLENKVIYSPILNYIQYKYTGKMHYYFHKHQDVFITPNHRIWGELYGSNEKSKGFGFIESKDLGKSESVNVPLEFNNIQESIINFKIEDIPFEYIGKNSHGTIHKIMKGLSINFTDWARFLGLWVAEGYISIDHNGSLTTVGISQSKEENLKVCSEIINKVHNKWSRTKNSWVCGKSTLARHLLEFSGKGTYDKRIPLYIKNASSEVINAFLEGFIIGDGTIDKNGRISMYTVNKELANDLMELSIKSGKWASIREREPRMWHIKGKSGWSKKQYEIIIWKTKKNITFKKDKEGFFEVDFNDDVFCVTTETQVILVKRNGKATWIGNCAQNLICHTSPEDKINQLAFPQAVMDMAKEHSGMFIWDMGLLMDKEGKLFFTEFCSNRLGWDAFPTELAMAESYTDYFLALMEGRDPLVLEYGAGIRIFNMTDKGCKEDAEVSVTEDADGVLLYDVYDDLKTVGKCIDLGVAIGAGETCEEAVENAYENMEKVTLESKYYRPMEDFLSYAYSSSILNRKLAAVEAGLINNEYNDETNNDEEGESDEDGNA